MCPRKPMYGSCMAITAAFFPCKNSCMQSSDLLVFSCNMVRLSLVFLSVMLWLIVCSPYLAAQELDLFSMGPLTGIGMLPWCSAWCRLVLLSLSMFLFPCRVADPSFRLPLLFFLQPVSLFLLLFAPSAIHHYTASLPLPSIPGYCLVRLLRPP